MSDSLALGVITYKPGANLPDRLEAALRAGYAVYLFDNTPEEPAVRGFAAKNPGRVVYATCGRNAGLGFGLASVCARAYYDGHGALLFFDQDTVFTPETLGFIKDFHGRRPELEKDYSAVVFNSKEPGAADEPLREVRLAVNSGSLYYLRNLKRMGWHNINYFVDCVDYEFCMSSYAKGLKVAEYTATPGFDHSSEQADSVHNFFGRPKAMRAYPLSRIWDSVTATAKLLVTALATGNLVYFREIGVATSKYLAIQAYVRVALLFGF